jgi:hypothetical protein
MSVLQDNTKRITSIHPKGLYTKSNIIILLHHLPIYIPTHNSKRLILVINGAFDTYSICIFYYQSFLQLKNQVFSLPATYIYLIISNYDFKIRKTIFKTMFEHELNILIQYTIFNPLCEPL